MSQVMNPQVTTAYNRLMELAETGRPYVDAEVFYPVPTEQDDPRHTQVVGRGYDFERTVEMTDRLTNQPVSGTAKLRVLRMTKGDEPTLFLRTRLEWATSADAKHASHASYILTSAAATKLANQSTEAEGPTEADF